MRSWNAPPRSRMRPAQPGSTTPTGSVEWGTEAGTIAPGSCGLIGGGGSTAWCAVDTPWHVCRAPHRHRAPRDRGLPRECGLRAKRGLTKALRQGDELLRSAQYGPACNPATTPKPVVGCGDPVNPATGNLVAGGHRPHHRGPRPALEVARTYNAAGRRGGRGRPVRRRLERRLRCPDRARPEEGRSRSTSARAPRCRSRPRASGSRHPAGSPPHSPAVRGRDTSSPSPTSGPWPSTGRVASSRCPTAPASRSPSAYAAGRHRSPRPPTPPAGYSRSPPMRRVVWPP